MDYTYIVVLITAPSLQVAKDVARVLVERRLAACVNLISPIQSLYHWEGKVNEDSEVLLVVKSRADIFEDQIIPAVQSIHPYDVPEIIALPILMGSTSYLDWIGDETSI